MTKRRILGAKRKIKNNKEIYQKNSPTELNQIKKKSHQGNERKCQTKVIVQVKYEQTKTKKIKERQTKKKIKRKFRKIMNKIKVNKKNRKVI